MRITDGNQEFGPLDAAISNGWIGVSGSFWTDEIYDHWAVVMVATNGSVVQPVLPGVMDRYGGASLIVANRIGGFDVAGSVSWPEQPEIPEWTHAIRVLANGQVDPSYGSAGIASVFSASNDVFTSTAVATNDGSLVVAGDSDFGGFEARLLPSGAIDPSFGNYGFRFIDCCGPDFTVPSHVVSTYPNGDSLFLEWPDGISAVRRTAAGELVWRAAIDSVPLSPFGGSMDTQGRVYLAWMDYPTHVAFVRLLSDGTLDRNFGVDGIARVSMPIRPAHISFTLDSRGRIVLCFDQWPAPGSGPSIADVDLVRLTRDGSVDETFAGTGFLRIEDSNPTAPFVRVLVDSVDRIYIVGYLSAWDGGAYVERIRSQP